jgi:aminocarboxymuconate-semialdehyde decarboxylase
MTRIIDCHAHILTEPMMAAMRKEAPAIGPTLSDLDAEGATLRVGDVVQKPFPRGGWDLERRFADLDAAGVGAQVVSVCPQTLLYDIEPSLALALAQVQNEAIAALVRQYPDRLMGLAHVPLQAPEQAAAELRRAMRDLGLLGMQIGSHCEGVNLDDPAFEPLWAEAEALSAFIMIHPQKPAGGKRTEANYFKNLIGNPLETTLAGGSLVFGGVMERYPKLRIMLVHGGGYIPYQFGRFNHGWEVRPEPKKRLPVSPEASVRRFYFDTLTHSVPALRYLVGEFGVDHVLFGTDYPFDMGRFDGWKQVRELGLSETDTALINGDGFAGLTGLGARRAAAE